MLVQQNINGSNFFNRSWAEFKVGFNDSRGYYWLSNERLHQLTNSGRYKLRFDLQARDNGSWYYAEYSTFFVSSEASGYTLHVAGFSGNAGDALWYHDGMMFSTYDRDNDQWSYNCAESTGGGFWYNNCGNCRVNDVLRTPTGFRWYGRVGSRNTAITLHLRSSRMWLMC